MLRRLVSSPSLRLVPFLLAAGWPAPARAQRVVRGPARAEATAGSALEAHALARQLDAATAFQPVGARALAARELRALLAGAAHPWAGRLAPDDSGAAGATIYLLRPSVGTVVNSSFPFGSNDGALWAGRGITAYASAGALLVAGPLTVRVEPLVFRAQNDAFRLFEDPRAPAEDRLREPLEPRNVDLPQRFGTRPYQRVDLGNSEVRLAGRGAAAGVSNALESWGPAVDHPLILGTNAPGFVHAFVGTDGPVPIGIGRLHGRVIVGRLEQSALSSTPDSLATRLASGIVATFVPRWLPNVELGGTRFFHRRWRAGDVPGAFRVPFEGLLFKERNLDVDDTSSTRFLPDNQIASAFVRWRLPRAGAEVYAEYARNDASFDPRELLTEPDHASAYLLGLRKSVARRADRLLVASGELVNARTTHLDRIRPQARFYQHGFLTQGHTQRGQVLGSVAVMGGGGVTLRLDDFTPRGRDQLALERIVRLSPVGEGAPSDTDVDVMHSLRAARTRFRGPLDLTVGATLTWERQRDFRADAFNARVDAAARLAW
ncbi:hypothetical protein [Roseisolibacter sp. H3M3-2]|uniref:hypothetical protein n=1 Tax=Roseisolibacter sp. H3M3-2 TaxID=3031323 RepID=UPI0023DCC553|nr:hypothetical protein [Roseisolibacter sp. H3M3-2]MDF1503780.1 hypothetical protein [Roseisolibacter sp. H3M3-2]